MSLLSIDGLSVDLPVEGRSRRVLQDVALTIGAGEAVGLVGESGSGKSMTVRAVARALPPGAAITGAIDFDGHDVSALAGGALRAYRAGDLGMIFQDPRAHINPVLRVGDFLVESLCVNRGVGRRDARRRVTEVLSDVGLAGADRIMRQYPHELSGGMLQRIMIAAAIVDEPRLLLADEPTTALDVTTQAEVVAILNALRAQRNLAILFVTHDIELAAAMCDRICVMYAGTVVETRRADRLHERPLHPYTEALLRARPSVEQRESRLSAIEGRPLSAFEAPEACPYEPRCTYAIEVCGQRRPRLEPLDGGLAACHRAVELLGARDAAEVGHG